MHRACHEVPSSPQTNDDEWREKELLSNATEIYLHDLQYSSDYLLTIVAHNSKGSSLPATMNFTVPQAGTLQLLHNQAMPCFPSFIEMLLCYVCKVCYWQKALARLILQLSISINVKHCTH